MKPIQPDGSLSEDELRYRSAFFEAQNEATPDGIVVVDTNGKMLYFNQRFVEMWKIPQEILDRNDDDAALKFGMTRLVEPEKFIKRVEFLYANPDKVSHEEIYFKDGQVLDRYGVPVVGTDGTKYGWAWYFRDITKAKNRDLQLKRQAEYAVALQQTALAIGKRLKIIPLLNTIVQHAAEIAGTGGGYIYLLDKSHKKLVVRVGIGVFEEFIGLEIRKGEGLAGRVWNTKRLLVVDNYDTWRGRSSSFPKSVVTSIAGIPLMAGNRFIGVIALTHTDSSMRFSTEDVKALTHIAELASIALENARLYEQAQKETSEREHVEMLNASLTEQQNRLLEINKSKDEFISLVSHQLRTPATGVKQYIGMLLDGYGETLSDAQREILQTAYDSNERQLRIVNDLLNVAQIDADKVTLNIQEFNLNEEIADITNEQCKTIKDRAQTVEIIDSQLPVSVSADKERLRMVIENLLDNASKYSPDGAKITIRFKNARLKTTITVTDNGVGIARKDYQKLFKKFSRIDNELSDTVTGSGLGLYWAQKVIELHGGTITVKSVPNVGSSFVISLPN